MKGGRSASWFVDSLPLLLALAAAVGAWMAIAVPLVLVVAAGALAACLRSKVMLLVVVALLTSMLAARAWADLEPPPPERFEGSVTLVSDPEPVPGGVRVDVKGGSRRSELWARGAAADELRSALAGERVAVVGWLEPARDQPWLQRRHIATRLTIDKSGPVRPGSLPSQFANAVRRTLVVGATWLDPDRRALYLGLVIGDDRGQSHAMVESFRAAGLTHLLVVSGQNVAFVLAIASPILSRLSIRSRLVSTLTLLAFFALLTRFEPSVLRATAMAALAATAVAAGRPTSRLRVIALAVTGLIVIDPFLVHSAGFALSVSACLGIILLAPPIEQHLPGPRFVIQPLAVTLGAQIGVAPLLIPLFGGVPVASIPANLLAGPAAGLVMMWGLTGGFVAGVVPAPLGNLLMQPAALGVGWIDGVARGAASLPLGQVDARSGIALVLIATATWLVRRWRRRRRSEAASTAPFARPPP